jgi:hypothetical protein
LPAVWVLKEDNGGYSDSHNPTPELASKPPWTVPQVSPVC